MSTSKKKIVANKINGQKSRGPKDTSSTRFNAQKHGLLAAGITELDDAESYREEARPHVVNRADLIAPPLDGRA